MHSKGHSPKGFICGDYKTADFVFCPCIAKMKVKLVQTHAASEAAGWQVISLWEIKDPMFNHQVLCGTF